MLGLVTVRQIYTGAGKGFAERVREVQGEQLWSAQNQKNQSCVKGVQGEYESSKEGQGDTD